MNEVKVLEDGVVGQFVTTEDGTLYMEIEVDGVIQLRRCEMHVGDDDGIARYRSLYKPVLREDEMLLETIDGQMRIVRRR